MTLETATPYFFFKAQAREAASFYQKALGAELKSLQTFGEVMSTCPAAMRDRVVHAEIKVGEATPSLSDGPADMPETGASHVQIALDCDDAEEMARPFDALAVGGEVLHPIHDTFYGGQLGALRDGADRSCAPRSPSRCSPAADPNSSRTRPGMKRLRLFLLPLTALSLLAGCKADASNGTSDAIGTSGGTAGAEDTGADPETGAEESSGGPDLAALYACEDPDFTILFPFGGPGFDPMTGELIEPLADEYVVSTTQLLPKADAASQQAFFDLTNAVIVELMQSPGLLGAGFAQEPNCGFMRTLTVWENEEAMLTFVSSDAHVEAMSQTFVVGVTGRVTSWTASADDMPPSWEGAIAKIAEIDPLGGY